VNSRASPASQSPTSFASGTEARNRGSACAPPIATTSTPSARQIPSAPLCELQERDAVARALDEDDGGWLLWHDVPHHPVRAALGEGSEKIREHTMRSDMPANEIFEVEDT
jgi:hypothetical protein